MKRPHKSKIFLKIALATTMFGLHARANTRINLRKFGTIEQRIPAKRGSFLFPKHEVKNKLAEILLQNKGKENFSDKRIKQIVERSYTPQIGWAEQIQLLGREFAFEKDKIIHINFIHYRLPEYSLEQIEEMFDALVDPGVCHGLNKLAADARTLLFQLKEEQNQKNKMEKERRRKNPTPLPKLGPNDPENIIMVKK